MPRCAGSKPNGEQCTTIVKPPQEYCYQHDPERKEERRRNASRAGKSKPIRDLQGVKSQLQDLTDKVLFGEVERANAAVCGQLLNVKLRAIEVERKIREQDELEARIEELENLLERQQRRPRGA